MTQTARQLAEQITFDSEVLAAWPQPCLYCGKQWRRRGMIEWELHCPYHPEHACLDEVLGHEQ